MEDLDEAKSKRSSAKGLVTSAVRKLTSSVELGMDDDALAQLLQGLEKAYEQFNLAHDTYVDLLPEVEDTAYFDSVYANYFNARKLHFKLVSHRLSKKYSNSFAGYLNRANKLLAELEELFANQSDSPDLDLMSEIVESVDSLVHVLLEEKMKLINLDCGQEEEPQAHDLVVRYDTLMLQVNVLSKQRQAKLLGTFSPMINAAHDLSALISNPVNASIAPVAPPVTSSVSMASTATHSSGSVVPSAPAVVSTVNQVSMSATGPQFSGTSVASVLGTASYMTPATGFTMSPANGMPVSSPPMDMRKRRNSPLVHLTVRLHR